VRAFLAIEIPDELKRKLAPLRTREQVRWVEPSTLHVTLRFLGEVDEEQVEEVAEAATTLARDTPPLRLVLRGGGSFPGRSRPHVLWVGLAGEVGRLTALVASLEAALRGLGFPAADHPFTPHVTVGRVKEGVPAEAVAKVEAIGELGHFKAESLILFRSDLRPSGAVHTELYRVPLGGPPPNTGS
jgi:RNA 2',3'-cyclic 3'-phosphodiesterase